MKRDLLLMVLGIFMGVVFLWNVVSFQRVLILEKNVAQIIKFLSSPPSQKTEPPKTP